MEKETALKILRERHAQALFSERTALETLIPELTENEDERIRKFLYHTFAAQYLCIDKLGKWHGEPVVNILSWLEKQEEQKPANISIKEKAHQIAWEISKHYDPNACKQEWCEMAAIDMASWLENQGESYTKKDVDDAWLKGICDAKQELEKQWEKILENSAKTFKNEEKTANKAEPKFKVGDWVVQVCNILKIRCVGNEYYCYETDGGYVDDMFVSEIDSLYHLWTIQDAKDGDVLYSSCCKLLWIYKDEKTCHVGYNLNYNSDSIVINKPICIPNDVQPATKEQRDILFAKMHEVGYEWDYMKKELNRIE